MSQPTFIPVRHVTDGRPPSGTYDVFDKLDGHRLMLRRGEAYRRGGTNEWDRLPAAIRDRATDELLDGELTTPLGNSDTVAHAIASDPDALRFSPFYLPDRDDLDAHEQHVMLSAMGWTPPAYLGRYRADAALTRWNTEWCGTVSEGVVLRPVGWGDWLKLKRSCTLDAVVVGVVPGKGRLAGLIGSVVCRLTDGATVKVGAGLVDSERTLSADSVIGRTIELAGLGRTASGSVRHPRFVRWRADLARA